MEANELTKTLENSVRVEGLNGQYVRIRFYSDGSITFWVSHATPMAITQAYLTGPQKPVIVQLQPIKN
jgi:hypothetical protein